MVHRFHCLECGRVHEEPAEAAFVLTVRCFDCELLALLETHVVASGRESHRAPAAA